MINHRGRKVPAMFAATICMQFICTTFATRMEKHMDTEILGMLFNVLFNCRATAGVMISDNKQRSWLFIFTRFMLPSKCYEYIRALIARDTRVSLESLRVPAGGHACNRRVILPHVEQIKRMEGNCKIPCRTLPCVVWHMCRVITHRSTSAKVKFQRQFRSRVAMESRYHVSPFIPFRSVYQPSGW